MSARNQSTGVTAIPPGWAKVLNDTKRKVVIIVKSRRIEEHLISLQYGFLVASKNELV